MPKPRANMGQAFERVLTLQHEAYRVAGIADIDKIPTPIRQLARAYKDKGTGGLMVFRATWAARSTVDYGGVLGVGRQRGRAVRIEVKSTVSDRVPLSSVREHQAASLDRTEKLGGFAAILVMIPAGVWIVPWDSWAAVGRKSLNPALLEQQGARVQDAERSTHIRYGMSTQVDWLTVALQRGWI